MFGAPWEEQDRGRAMLIGGESGLLSQEKSDLYIL